MSRTTDRKRLSDKRIVKPSRAGLFRRADEIETFTTQQEVSNAKADRSRGRIWSLNLVCNLGGAL